MNKLRRLWLVIALCISVITVSAQKTYVVSVGISNYQNNWCNPLSFTSGDAKSVAKFFGEHRDSDVFMLIDKNATRDHILRVLKAKFSKATEGDEIIFVYSGHGYDGGVTAWDENEFISCSEIQNIMKQSKARRKVMFLGSCHSGSFTKPDNNSGNNSRGGGNGYRSANSNVILYVSSRANELSWGYTGASNSFFINRLLEGLRGRADANSDRKITVRELFNYVNKKVLEDSNNSQHPQMYGKFDDDTVIVALD